MKNCKCIEKIEKLIQKRSSEIEAVSIANVEILSGRGYSEFIVYVKGKKKPVTKKVIHEFCAFCGKEYTKKPQ